MRFFAIFVCGLGVILVTACATPTVELKHPQPFEEAPDKPRYAWHSLRFRWSWPEGQAPRWFLDTLAADLILSDLIGERQASLPLWRFHRRAGRGPAGHQFSFIYYAAPATARELQESVDAHTVTRQLLQRGLLEKVYSAQPARASELSAGSDRSWPKPIQSSWPMFIMGVSQTWLGLVEIHAGDTTGLDEDLSGALERYELVNDKVNGQWREHGQHAFFHHLSGVFGYQPLTIRKRMRF